MGIFGRNLVKLKGLNGRQVAVVPEQINYLCEIENDGKFVTNIYFHNTTFVTVALSLNETCAVLDPPKEENNERQDAEDLKRWRRQAEARRKAQMEVDAAVKCAGVDMELYKRAGYSVENNAAGDKLITVRLERKEPLTEESDKNEG